MAWSLLFSQIIQRINRNAVFADFEVEMWTGCEGAGADGAGPGAGITDYIAAGDELVFVYADTAHMAIDG